MIVHHPLPPVWGRARSCSAKPHVKPSSPLGYLVPDGVLYSVHSKFHRHSFSFSLARTRTIACSHAALTAAYVGWGAKRSQLRNINKKNKKKALKITSMHGAEWRAARQQYSRAKHTHTLPIG